VLSLGTTVLTSAGGRFLRPEARGPLSARNPPARLRALQAGAAAPEHRHPRAETEAEAAAGVQAAAAEVQPPAEQVQPRAEEVQAAAEAVRWQPEGEEVAASRRVVVRRRPRWPPRRAST
jgi:hypothetical protein